MWERVAERSEIGVGAIDPWELLTQLERAAMVAVSHIRHRPGGGAEPIRIPVAAWEF